MCVFVEPSVCVSVCVRVTASPPTLWCKQIAPHVAQNFPLINRRMQARIQFVHRTVQWLGARRDIAFHSAHCRTTTTTSTGSRSDPTKVPFLYHHGTHCTRFAFPSEPKRILARICSSESRGSAIASCHDSRVDTNWKKTPKTHILPIVVFCW